jgi:8-amino-7-oxononanoate synthase
VSGRPATAAAGTSYADAPPVWSAWTDEACRVVEAAGQWRRPRTFDARGQAGLVGDPGGADGGPTAAVSFAGNDYLGLSSHPAVMEAAHLAIDRWGTGSGASRLVTGSRPVHRELEEALASWKGTERAVLLPTGFAANLSVLSVFGAEGAHVFSDELNHASLIDGCRLARARVTVYRHGDLGQLDRALAASRGRSMIVSDSVFSMDGDAADVAGLVELAQRHGALLVLDEAHAVLGPGLPERVGRAVVLRVGTLSKQLGSLGGFVAGPARFMELLVNRARPYIFTTAPTPADAAAALAALGVVRSGEGEALRSRLSGHVARVAGVVGLAGHPSPIVPVVIGDEEEAVAASAGLLDKGLWVPAIRPPTVAPGTSRLRVTLSAVHTDEQVDRLVAALGVIDRPGVLDRLGVLDRPGVLERPEVSPRPVAHGVPAGTTAPGGDRAS